MMIIKCVKVELWYRLFGFSYCYIERQYRKKVSDNPIYFLIYLFNTVILTNSTRFILTDYYFLLTRVILNFIDKLNNALNTPLHVKRIL